MRMFTRLLIVFALLPFYAIAEGFNGSGDYVYSENASTFMKLSFKKGGEVQFVLTSPTRNASASGRFEQEGETLKMTFPDVMKKYPELKSAFPERKPGQLEGRLFIERDGALSVEGLWALQFRPQAH